MVVCKKTVKERVSSFTCAKMVPAIKLHNEYQSINQLWFYAMIMIVNNQNCFISLILEITVSVCAVYQDVTNFTTNMAILLFNYTIIY